MAGSDSSTLTTGSGSFANGKKPSPTAAIKSRSSACRTPAPASAWSWPRRPCCSTAPGPSAATSAASSTSRIAKRPKTPYCASEARLQGILDNTPAMIYVKDLDGRFLLVNRRCEEVFRLSTSRFNGSSPRDLFPTAVADQWLATDRTVIETDRPIQVEESLPQADGTQTYLTVKFPIHDAAGAPRRSAESRRISASRSRSARHSKPSRKCCATRSSCRSRNDN